MKRKLHLVDLCQMRKCVSLDYYFLIVKLVFLVRYLTGVDRTNSLVFVLFCFVVFILFLCLLYLFCYFVISFL